MKNLMLENGGYIAGVTFGYDLKRDDYFSEDPLLSLEQLKKETNANTIVLAFHALQDDPQSVTIDYISPDTPTKEGLKRIVDKARELSMNVILKPMLDCRNGTWRGHINFFDKDVPCEPKWSDWFKSYTEFQVYFAKIAKALDVDMLCIACEMVQTQRRDADWRSCISEIRKYYDGPLTWNCDKYQEDEVTFWDALDVISASGYYPIDSWDDELLRIKAVADKFNKPFFFIECGCMTCKSSPEVPNAWGRFKAEIKAEAAKNGIAYNGEAPEVADKEIRELYKRVVDFNSQADFYKTVFDACDKQSFVRGFGLWDWQGKLRTTPNNVCFDGGYGVHLKPSAQIIKEYFTKKQRSF